MNEGCPIALALLNQESSTYLWVTYRFSSSVKKFVLNSKDMVLHEVMHLTLPCQNLSGIAAITNASDQTTLFITSGSSFAEHAPLVNDSRAPYYYTEGNTGGGYVYRVDFE